MRSELHSRRCRLTLTSRWEQYNRPSQLLRDEGPRGVESAQASELRRVLNVDEIGREFRVGWGGGCIARVL